MHPKRRQRLILVIFVVVLSSVAIGLTIFALRKNLNLFYPPSTIVNGEAPVGTSIRAGGCVIPGTVVRTENGLHVNFDITDGMANISATYDGILPDLFAEGEAVVLTGMLNQQGVFEATKVLAKHDENYMPPEVSGSMKVTGENHAATCKAIKYDS